AATGMVVAIDYDVRAADGTVLQQLIHKTIHRVPNESLQTVPERVSRREVTPPVEPERPAGAPEGDWRTAPLERGRVVTVSSVGTALSYEPAAIRATAGETLTVRYENVGSMTHNLVVVRS